MEVRERELRLKCRDDFEFYAAKALKIRTKEEGIQPFVLNRSQQHLHIIAEQQFAEHGYVRLIVLKGRQQGISTYIGGRFYWKATHKKGERAFILTHDGEATNNLFGMTKRFHDLNNPLLKPSTDKDSGSELNFDALDSGYKVGTARSKGTGRSQTVQYFHGSEVAFWEHAEEHVRAVMQAIPTSSGEAWLESTADGVGNFFHKTWVQATKGDSVYIPVFLPWWWELGYAINAPDFERDEVEIKYAEMCSDYHGEELTDEQLAWRRLKINSEFNGSVEDFQREYPATPMEAFESNTANQYIPTDLVIKAYKTKEVYPVGPIILGVDVGGEGNDRSSLYHRQGRYAKKVWSEKTPDLMDLVGRVKWMMDNNHYDAVFIDKTGLGVGVVARLQELGYPVIGINFGSNAFNKEMYVNKRNEMHGEVLEWLRDEPVWIDDDTDATMIDLCAMTYKRDSLSRRVLIAKDKMKKDLGYSPDDGDALALTFAEPVMMDEEYYHAGSGGHDGGRDMEIGY